MAIREVLVSFTFEQQRQMLNLIGADVGDASLLLTPTNVVVTAINEIITGDVDLSNQTIGMDDGTLASPSLFWDVGQGFYKVDANKLGLTTSLAVTGNLEVDGDITFRAGSGTGGTLTFGDLDTDNIVINADVQSSIVPDSTANYNLGTLAKQWNNLWIDGTASIDTLEVDLDSTLTGELAVNSGIIKVDPSTVGTASIFNNYIATANVLMDATAVTVGSDAPGQLMVRNSNIITPKTTINVFNTVAETVNAFGAASNVTTGFSTFGTTGVNSNFNIRSDDTVLDGDLNVNGGEILSQENTFDLLIANNDVRIGAANGAGETVINNSLKVAENVNLANSGTNITIKDNTTNALAIKEGSNTYITFQTTDASERVIVYKDLYVVGNLDISGTSTVIDTTTLTVEDKNIELGTSGSPSDATADGGGITLKGDTDKTITYSNASGMWETNIGLEVKGTVTAGAGNDEDLQRWNIASDNVKAEIKYIDTAADRGMLFGTTTDHVLAFQTNNTERLRITSDGKVSISSDGTVDGLLTIKGNSDAVTTPSIRLLDDSDTREVSISNTSGDFVATVHGTDNAAHGHIKMFESGIFAVATGGASGSNTERLRINENGLLVQNERYSTFTNASSINGSGSRTLTITGLRYGTATIHFGGSDGNGQYVHFKINLGGQMWGGGNGYEAVVTSTGNSGSSYSVTKNNTSYVISVTAGSNVMYYSYTFKSTSYTSGNYATIAET